MARRLVAGLVANLLEQLLIRHEPDFGVIARLTQPAHRVLVDRQRHAFAVVDQFGDLEFLLEPVYGDRDVITALLDPNGRYDFIGVNGNGKKFFSTDWNNVGPVLSFAW